MAGYRLAKSIAEPEHEQTSEAGTKALHWEIIEAGLNNSSDLVRIAALGALERCEQLEVGHLKDFASDPSPKVRSRVCELAVALARQNAHESFALQQAASENSAPQITPPHPTDRSTHHTAENQKVSSLLPTILIERLDDSDPSVTETACFTCGEFPWHTTDIAPPVTKISEIATDHQDALCRESAAAALGAIGDEAGLKAVLQASHDRVTVRRRAVLALAAFDDPAVDERLEQALQDKDWQVRQAAEDLLGVGRFFEDHANDENS